MVNQNGKCQLLIWHHYKADALRECAPKLKFEYGVTKNKSVGIRGYSFESLVSDVE